MATIRSIEMDESGEPEFVTVRMSVEEAAFVAKNTGKHSGTSADELMRGGATANSRLYDAIAGELFNRYYDGGVDEYLGGRS